jgi:hypothetical protein
MYVILIIVLLIIIIEILNVYYAMGNVNALERNRGYVIKFDDKYMTLNSNPTNIMQSDPMCVYWNYETKTISKYHVTLNIIHLPKRFHDPYNITASETDLSLYSFGNPGDDCEVTLSKNLN